MPKQLIPHITVASIVENNDQYLLVSENIHNKLVYNQPAGHLELSESLIEAAIRETLEETGWQTQPYAVVGIYLYKANPQDTFLRICFASNVIKQQMDKPLDVDIVAAHWLNYSQIIANADKMRSPLVIQCIDDYQAGKRHPLELLSSII